MCNNLNMIRNDNNKVWTAKAVRGEGTKDSPIKTRWLTESGEWVTVEQTDETPAAYRKTLKGIQRLVSKNRWNTIGRIEIVEA